jgi:soluble lytic murein transglycosylase
MFLRLAAAAATLVSFALPAYALNFNRLPDEPLTTASQRMKVKDYAGAREAALKSSDQVVRPFLLGMSNLRLERWEEAATALATATKSFPLLADYALYDQGVALCKLKRWDQALAPLFRVLKQYPDSSQTRAAMLLYADALAACGLPDKAIECYTLFIERYPAGGDAISALLGLALCREKLNPATAVASLKGVWLDYPSSKVAVKAAAELQKLGIAGVKIVPYTKAELFKRACLLSDLGRNTLAVKALAEISPSGESKEFAALLRLKTGQALFKARRYQEAQAAFAGAIQGETSAQEENFWLAKCLEKSGNSEEAYRIYLQLAKTSKSVSVADDAILQAAYLKRFQGKWGEALKLFNMYIAKYPSLEKSGRAVWEAAWASYQCRDYQGAAAYLRKLTSREDMREKSLYWLSRALVATGDTKGAEQPLAALASEYPLGYYALISNRWVSSLELPLPPKSPLTSLPMPAGFDREKALITLGLLGEAARELARTSKGGNPGGIARLYLEMGNYNGAMLAAAKEKPKRGDKGSQTAWALSFPLAYSEEVAQSAFLTGVPESLIYAIMRTESNYSPAALSPVGAVGLMQIMPATAETISLGASARLTTPGLNIRLGARQLKTLLNQYDKNIPLAAAAYNAGGKNVNRWQKVLGALPQDEFIESIPFRETREYVKKVVTAMALYQRLYRLPPYKN